MVTQARCTAHLQSFASEFFDILSMQKLLLLSLRKMLAAFLHWDSDIKFSHF